MLDRRRTEIENTSVLSVASGEAVLGESTSTLSLTDLEEPRILLVSSSSSRCNVRNLRGHKRVRQYNMSSNDGSFQALSLSATSFGSLRSPTGRFPSTADGKSPRRFLRSTTPKTRRRMLESMRGTFSERSLNDSVKLEKEERIGSEKLKNISEHRRGIAQMRPKERRIQFRYSKKTTTPTRIDSLRVDDLSLHLMRICMDEAEKSEAEIQDEEIRRLEAGIKKCLSEIERVKKDTKKEAELAVKIRAENKELMAGISSISTPYKQSVKQAQRQLESTIRALKHEIHAIDNQMTVLNNRKLSNEAGTQTPLSSSCTSTEERSPLVFQRKRTILYDSDHDR